MRLVSLSSRRTLAATALLTIGLAAGCGIGTTAGPADVTIPSIAGVLHGGQSPIQGSAITLYVTNTTATTYGAAATAVGTATSDVNGNFTLSPSVTAATCPVGQQVYIAAAGGYPSGQPTLANTSSLLMVALGDCANVSSSTHVIMNEVTTVAAAYALSGFMTTNGTTVNVSAPAANRVSTPDSTDSSGLQHAFLNAASLAGASTGMAVSTTASTSAAGASVTGTAPAVEVNTLGDILQSCVNSATGSTACATLFADTPSVTGVAPTNTLQAMINLARNPYPSAAAMSTAAGNTSLFSLVSSSAAFVPALSAQPPDWALAVVWKLSTAPYYLALDANDTVYFGSSTGLPTIVALSAYGNSTPTFASGTAGSTTRQVATDALGNVWVGNNAANLLEFNEGTGALTNTITITGGDVYGVAIDKANNVWVGNAVVGSSTVPSVLEYAYTAGTGGTLASYNLNYEGYLATYEPTALAIDQNQNVWAAPYYTTGTVAAVLPNTTVGTANAPAYGTAGTPTLMVTTTLAGTKPLGLVFDTTGDAWYGITGSNSVTTTGLNEVVPNTFTGTISSLTAGPLVADATLGAKASQIPGIDGAGTIYLPDNQGGGAAGIHAFSSTPGTKTSLNGTAAAAADQQVLSPPAGYLGCAVAAGATACGTGSASAVYNPRQIVIDSTGSVWAGITSGGLTQVIGLGAPTYPLQSIGKPSLSPGLTAVKALP